MGAACQAQSPENEMHPAKHNAVIIHILAASGFPAAPRTTQCEASLWDSARGHDLDTLCQAPI